MRPLDGHHLQRRCFSSLCLVLCNRTGFGHRVQHLIATRGCSVKSSCKGCNDLDCESSAARNADSARLRFVTSLLKYALDASPKPLIENPACWPM